MADYYSIIAKAVEALDPNTGEARRRLYDRARGALGGHTRTALGQSDIRAARMSLEEAIARVEVEVLRAEEAKASAPARPIPPRPRPPVPRVTHDPGPLTRLWARMFGSAGRRRATSAEPRITAVPPTPAPAAPKPATRDAGRDKPRPMNLDQGRDDRREKGRDTWLTDLLARASRDEDDDEDHVVAPPPKIRRIR